MPCPLPLPGHGPSLGRRGREGRARRPAPYGRRPFFFFFFFRSPARPGPPPRRRGRPRRDLVGRGVRRPVLGQHQLLQVAHDVEAAASQPLHDRERVLPHPFGGPPRRGRSAAGPAACPASRGPRRDGPTGLGVEADLRRDAALSRRSSSTSAPPERRVGIVLEQLVGLDVETQHGGRNRRHSWSGAARAAAPSRGGCGPGEQSSAHMDRVRKGSCPSVSQVHPSLSGAPRSARRKSSQESRGPLRVRVCHSAGRTRPRSRAV